jgi:hypothetical protein
MANQQPLATRFKKAAIKFPSQHGRRFRLAVYSKISLQLALDGNLFLRHPQTHRFPAHRAKILQSPRPNPDNPIFAVKVTAENSLLEVLGGLRKSPILVSAIPTKLGDKGKSQSPEVD